MELKPYKTMALAITLACTLYAGYGWAADSERLSLAKAFFSGLQQNDFDTIRPMVSDPMFIPAADAGDSHRIEHHITSFSASEEPDGTVTVIAQRFCRDYVSFPVTYTEQEGKLLISSMSTLTAMYNAGNPNPTKKYCYGFKDQPLQTTVNGAPWVGSHVDFQEFDFGDRIKVKAFVASEPCPDNGGCLVLTSPVLDISNLDFSGDGGNLSAQQSLSMRGPSKSSFTEGSYKIESLASGKKRLNINAFNSTQQLSGHIDL